LRQVEKDVARLEKKKARLNDELVEAGSDHAKLTEIGVALAQIDADLSVAEDQWMELADEQEQNNPI
jgi:uncharacterized protein involved in exopolysaccharide biosynthesis